MTFNIVEAIESKITTDQIGKIAQSTGESPSKTRQAMSLGVVAIVGNLIRRVSNPSGASALLSSLAGGGGNVRTLLGDQADSTADALSRSGGVSHSAASTILSSLAPITATVLGREATSRHLNADGLADMLTSQKRLMSTTTSEAGRDVSVSSTPHVPTAIPRAAEPVVAKKRGSWLPLALGVLAIGVIAAFALNHRTEAVPKVAMPVLPGVGVPRAPDLPQVLPPGGPEVPPAPEAPVVSSPTLTGADIQGSPAAKGDDISNAFNGSGALPERVALPGVKFDFASTNMTSGADAELDRLATLMKDKPSAKIRLEGNTDNVGDPDLNARLSYARASTVKKDLIDRGVDESRIETIGKRDLVPVSPNDNAEGRASNRRVDAVLLSR